MKHNDASVEAVEMKFTEAQFERPCGCRSVGECFHNNWSWLTALEACVDAFAADMKAKLKRKALHDRKSGWDDPEWPIDNIIHQLREHIEKGDMVDVANFAMFAWNRGVTNYTRPASRPQDDDVRECVWVGSRFDNWWYSGCNNRLELTNGKDPIINGFKFCSYCGRHLKATSDGRKLARVGGDRVEITDDFKREYINPIVGFIFHSAKQLGLENAPDSMDWPILREGTDRISKLLGGDRVGGDGDEK